MAVLLTAKARVLAVNGMGAYGGAQVRFMRTFGTNVVGHVALGRSATAPDGLPVFATVAEAVAATAADAAAIFTPAAGLRDSVVEAAHAGLRLVFAAAEFVPLHDAAFAAACAREAGMWMVGPNSNGMTTPGQAVLGALPPGITRPGRIGVIGRSGTLTLNVCQLLTCAGLGQSTAVHIGGDIICGRNPHEWLGLYLQDPATDLVVYLGEPGGSKEYAMLETLAAATKPVVTLVVGRHVPRGKRMGHAGALAGTERETAAAKIAALRAAGAHIAASALHIAPLVHRLLQSGPAPSGAVS